MVMPRIEDSQLNTTQQELNPWQQLAKSYAETGQSAQQAWANFFANRGGAGGGVQSPVPVVNPPKQYSPWVPLQQQQQVAPPRQWSVADFKTFGKIRSDSPMSMPLDRNVKEMWGNRGFGYTTMGQSYQNQIDKARVQAQGEAYNAKSSAEQKGFVDWLARESNTPIPIEAYSGLYGSKKYDPRMQSVYDSIPGHPFSTAVQMQNKAYADMRSRASGKNLTSQMSNQVTGLRGDPTAVAKAIGDPNQYIDQWDFVRSHPGGQDFSVVNADVNLGSTSNMYGGMSSYYENYANPSLMTEQELNDITSWFQAGAPADRMPPSLVEKFGSLTQEQIAKMNEFAPVTDPQGNPLGEGEQYVWTPWGWMLNTTIQQGTTSFGSGGGGGGYYPWGYGGGGGYGGGKSAIYYNGLVNWRI